MRAQPRKARCVALAYCSLLAVRQHGLSGPRRLQVGVQASVSADCALYEDSPDSGRLACRQDKLPVVPQILSERQYRRGFWLWDWTRLPKRFGAKCAFRTEPVCGASTGLRGTKTLLAHLFEQGRDRRCKPSMGPARQESQQSSALAAQRGWCWSSTIPNPETRV